MSSWALDRGFWVQDKEPRVCNLGFRVLASGFVLAGACRTLNRITECFKKGSVE